jgi:hypothetical protein
MDRVALLELQECLLAATTTSEQELNPTHLRTFSRIAKENGQAVNEAVARCWDWVSALQIATPVSKKSKYMEREVTAVYSRIRLAWKFLMYMVRKSQWAMRFITDQPRLNVLSQGILHLASLVPIHRNIWEKPQSRTLATTIYEDMKHLHTLISNKPLMMALEFLKRKGVPQLLQARVAVPLQSIDKFYRLKSILKSKLALASPLIENCRDEFGASKIRSFRSKSPFDPSLTPSTQPLASNSTHLESTSPTTTSLETEKEESPETGFSGDVPPGWLDDESEFDDIEFEDVVGSTNAPLEGSKPAEDEEIKEKPIEGLKGSDPLEKYCQRNRTLDEISKQVALIQKKVLEINDRENWLPNQKVEYTELLHYIDDLLELLAICIRCNTDFIASSPLNLSESGIVIEFSAR